MTSEWASRDCGRARRKGVQRGRKIKVLHIINDLGTGGTENLCARNIACLTQTYKNIENKVCVLGSATRVNADYVARLSDEPVYLNFSGKYRNTPAVLGCIHKVRSLICAEKPDLVHSYLWLSDIVTRLATLGTKVPQLAHVVDRRHRIDSPRWQERTKARLTGWLHRYGQTQFVAVSDACRVHALENYRINAASVITAHNGIEIQEFGAPKRQMKNEADVIILGTMSNLVEEKGHQLLIQVVEQLVNGSVPVRLKVAGDGKLRRHLEREVEGRELKSSVEFLGRATSPASFYRSIDVFVNPSIYAEGLPTTILEAMASRLPTIASDVGGTTEAIRDDKEGLVVPPGNREALRDAIMRLVNDRALIMTMGDAAFARVNTRFTVQRMTRTIVEHCYKPLARDAAEPKLVER